MLTPKIATSYKAIMRAKIKAAWIGNQTWIDNKLDQYYTMMGLKSPTLFCTYFSPTPHLLGGSKHALHHGLERPSPTKEAQLCLWPV